MARWRPFFTYTAARLLLFVAMLVLLYAVGVRGAGVVLLAVLMSGVVSYLTLRRQRTALATSLSAAIERRQARTAARTAREDAIADQLIAEQDRSADSR